MTIMQLCEAIQMPVQVQRQIKDLKEGLDFDLLNSLISSFYHREQKKTVHTQLQQALGEDPGNMKMLACMLYISAVSYETCRARGIPDEVYYDTMKCYSRFLQETFRRTGIWEFDRYWWTARQAGCHLFRIGQLEYEMKTADGQDVIGIHIPSDADFSPEAVDKSLALAKQFFQNCFPTFSGCDYICHSWLLDRQLREFLRRDSNITSFQNRFAVYDKGEASDDFLEWLFQTRNRNIADLPETTSLQRNVKAHLLAGGCIFNSYGKLM